ncbi:MAG: GreA/GreB family elongation factor [Mollicutes bacterium]|nr:MAG: GreA/GreB family elongation factor [Mollicutes bacterium]
MKIKHNKAEKLILTKQNVFDLESERELLVNVKRKQIIKELREARKQGDLSENAEYDAAKQKQSILEKRITEINALLNNYTIVQKKQSLLVKIGKTVTIERLDNHKTLTYKIGTISDINFEKKIISSNSPLAQSILNRHVGEKVFVKGLKVSY